MVEDQHTATLESHLIWNYIKAGLQGEDIPGKALSCETPEFGVISQKEITQTLEHIFGAKIKKKHGIRKIAFDVSKLQRLGRVYDLDIEVKVVKDGDSSFEHNRGADWTDWTDVGMSKYLNPSTKEPQNFTENESPERESTPANGLVDSPHPPNAVDPTPIDDMSNEAMRRRYEELNKKSLKASRDASKQLQHPGPGPGTGPSPSPVTEEN